MGINSVLNMKKIIKSLIETRKRPDIFSRSNKTNQKDAIKAT